MQFSGWPAEALDFFDGLEADNSRSYWLAHKPVYEDVVRAPMLALLATLAPEFGPGTIFRPYRDVRFSKDKTPYKTGIGASLRDGYVELSARGLAAGRGMYVMAPDQLERYRRAVADDVQGAALERVDAALAKKGLHLQGRDVLRTAPRGYDRDHPRIELLRFKGVIVWKAWEVEPWLGTAAASKRVATFFRAAAPLDEWLATNVGPSTLSPDDRRR